MASNGGKVAGKRKASDDEMTEDDGIVYIEFSIRGQDGNELFFKVNQDRPLKQAFQRYCRQLNLQLETINFMFEGKHIRGDRITPRMLKMIDGDQIDAAKHQTGGGGAAGGN
ncbi:small ubiquitin-related modifier [Trifolium repens]|nr:small ubiquitin-related modifier [Trifolium repens]